MSAKINKAAMFRRAHEIARWRVMSVGKAVKPYREWFAEALRSEYRKMHQAKLREDQNLNGLPLASCRADFAPRPVSYMRASGFVARAFAG
ncbi:hypothetical protein AMST5_00742 [freshwater sediment metagenome]|jgi:hypothetical protein|uniref:Uncharacterized protein n=1 Tax=freshwater sediment metagenome TaxID=556182 RepID=A0AA48LXI5_9ZZZZ